MGGGVSKNFFEDMNEINSFIEQNNPNIQEKYEKDGDGIQKEEFSSLLKLKRGKDFDEGIFHIFENSNHKISIKNFKGFYFMFKGDNELTLKYKKKLVENLLFSSEKEVEETKYIENAVKYFDEEQLRFLFGKTLRDELKITKKPNLYSKTKFHDHINLVNPQLFNDMHVKTEKSAKNYKGEFSNAFMYICDCCNNNEPPIGKDFLEERYLNSFQKMEEKFKEVELKNKVFSIKYLESVFENYKVNKTIIKIISRYLTKKTSNTFINFDIFRDLMIQIAKTKTEEEQIDLICSFLAYPSDSQIDKETINFLVKDSNIECNFEVKEYSKGEFIFIVKNSSDQSMTGIVDSIPISLDKICIVSFIEFLATPFEPFHFQKLKNYLLFKNTIFSLLKESIQNYDEFYVIDAEFVTKLQGYLENSQINLEIPVINTRKISDNKNCLESGMKFQKDFFFAPKLAYENYLLKWFKKEGDDIMLKKIKYPPPLNLKEEDLPENMILNKENQIEEVEYFPVSIKYVTFRDIFYAKVIKREPIDQNTLFRVLDKLYRDKKSLASQRLKFSRKLTLKEVFQTIEKRLDKTVIIKPKFHIYYKNRLSTDEINQATTLEEQKINDWCLVLINSMKSKEPMNITYLQEFQVEFECELPSDSFDCFTENSSILNRTSTRRFSRVSSLYLKREKDPSLVGLNNLGNTCYMNSVLQILINMPELGNIFLDKRINYFVKRIGNKTKGKVFDELRELIKVKLNQHNKGSSFSPMKFRSVLSAEYNDLEQKDAGEFLNYLIFTLHEELNINYKEIDFNVNPKLNKLTDEELSTFHFSNFIRKSPSFINSLFFFQVMSRFECKKCHHKKHIFSQNNALFLPIPLSKKINLVINLYRLPFLYKIYFDEINPVFKQLCNSNELSKLDNLNIYLQQHLSDEYEEDIINMSVPLKIEMEFSKSDTVRDLIFKLQKEKSLQLEPRKEIPLEFGDQELSKNKVLNSTNLLVGILKTYNNNNLIILTEDMKLEECVQENQIVFVFEVLNSNGINIIRKKEANAESECIDEGNYNEKEKYVLTNFVMKNNKPAKFDEKIQQIKKKSIPKEGQIHEGEEILGNSLELTQKDLLTIDNFLMYYNSVNSVDEVVKKKEIEQIEFYVGIKHFYQELYENYYFERYQRKQIFFPFDVLIVNNTETNFNGRSLYDLIWAKYKRFMKEPSAIEGKRWWDCTDATTRKFCYPFTLKICTNDKNQYLRCSHCLWYKFCTGCTINPFDPAPLKFDLNNVLVVEWCKEIFTKELVQPALNYIHRINKEENEKDSTQPEDAENNAEPELLLENLIDDYLKETELVESIECESCKTKGIFRTQEIFDKTSPILCICLKRFKYTRILKKKIETFIKYPLAGLKIKDDVYDLYGVINHIGNLEGGHYTSIIKVEKKWILFDDSRYDEIPPERVINKRAYILVYRKRTSETSAKEDCNEKEIEFNGIMQKDSISEKANSRAQSILRHSIIEKKDAIEEIDNESDDSKKGESRESSVNSEMITSCIKDFEKDVTLFPKSYNSPKLKLREEIKNLIEEKSTNLNKKKISSPQVKYESNMYLLLMKSLMENIKISEANKVLSSKKGYKNFYAGYFVGEPIWVKMKNGKEKQGYISNYNEIELETVFENGTFSYKYQQVQISTKLTIADEKVLKEMFDIKDESEELKKENGEESDHDEEKGKKKKSKCVIF